MSGYSVAEVEPLLTAFLSLGYVYLFSPRFPGSIITGSGTPPSVPVSVYRGYYNVPIGIYLGRGGLPKGSGSSRRV